jgi:hypothetical protein
MVILGGLEIVAAGYLIHKHQQNKKDRARAEAEEAAIEEEEYRRRHGKSEHRRRRRHSRERRHSYSYDGKNEYRPRPTMKPPAPQQISPASMAQQSTRPPPPYNSVPTATSQPPQDIKYGWTDEPAPQQQPPQQDPNFPPTGWPSHWPQSQTLGTGSRLGPQQPHGGPSYGRPDGRATSASPHVRFAAPKRQRSPSFTPPPSYRE